MKAYKRIAVIDDSNTLISRLKEEDEKVSFYYISSPPFFDEDIRNLLKEFNPDLILLDLLLYDDMHSGERVLRKLKQDPDLSHIPVAVISKYIRNSETDIKDRMKAYGAKIAIPKTPFPKLKEIINFIENETKD